MPSLTMEYNFRALTGQRITPGNTATAIGTNIIKYVEHKLHIDSGGTTAIVAGNRILGATSGASAMVLEVGALESGTWAGGNAVCWLKLCSVVGTFQDNEHITVEGAADDADVDGTAVELSEAEYVRKEYRGMTARKLIIQAEGNDQRISWNGYLPTQTSKMGLLLEKGYSVTLTDASDMKACYVIDAVASSAGYCNVVGQF